MVSPIPLIEFLRQMPLMLAAGLVRAHDRWTRDDVLDDITLYWVTNTGISAGRLYWENKLNLYNAADVSIPAAVSVKPRGAGQSARIASSSITTKLTKAGTMQPGNSRDSFQKRFARTSYHCAVNARPPDAAIR